MADRVLQMTTEEIREMIKSAPFHSGFRGDNLAPGMYTTLAMDLKMQIQRALLEANREWIRERLREKRAAWIAVVDGEVVDFSPDLDKYPQESDIQRICQTKGKFPFIFVNDRLMVAEESSSPWSKTEPSCFPPDDFYPTVRIEVSRMGLTSGTLPADLDTGAFPVFFNLEVLRSLELFRESVSDVPNQPEGERYWYVNRTFSIGLLAEDGAWRTAPIVSVACVLDWESTRFVAQNPSRVALVGRELLNKLRPTVTLRFSDKVTEVHY